MAPEQDYNADDIVKLEYPYSIWKRPSMYLGERGGQQTVGAREVTDNAVHEGVRGFATRIKVTFGADKSVAVQDNGRGLPVDENTKLKTNGIILTMATLHAGANFSSNVAAGKAGAGLNGVGAAATNALSKRYSATVYRSNKIYTLDFQDGFPGHFAGPTSEDKFTPGTKIKEAPDKRPASEKKIWKTGTQIKLWFNESRFSKDEQVILTNWWIG